MNRTLCALSALVSTAMISSAASAGLPYGAGVSIVVPNDNVTVTVIFDHSAAEYSGKLYFMGTGDDDTVTTPAPNTNGAALGQFLFHNHITPIGTTRDLIGTFNAGDVLHFAYDIVAPGNAVTDLLRTPIAADKDQFAWDPQLQYFMVEDTHINNPQSDEDYNDIVVGVCFNAVPGPGALATLALAGLLGRGRRRR